MSDTAPQGPQIQINVQTIPQMPGFVMLTLATPFGPQTYPIPFETAKELARQLEANASPLAVPASGALVLPS